MNDNKILHSALVAVVCTAVCGGVLIFGTARSHIRIAVTQLNCGVCECQAAISPRQQPAEHHYYYRVTVPLLRSQTASQSVRFAGSTVYRVFTVACSGYGLDQIRRGFEVVPRATKSPIFTHTVPLLVVHVIFLHAFVCVGVCLSILVGISRNVLKSDLMRIVSRKEVCKLAN